MNVEVCYLKNLWGYGSSIADHGKHDGKMHPPVVTTAKNIKRHESAREHA